MTGPAAWSGTTLNRSHTASRPHPTGAAGRSGRISPGAMAG